MARSATQMEALEVLDTITLVIGVILLVVATVAPCIVAWLIIKERSRPGAQSKVADLYSRLVGRAGWSVRAGEEWPHFRVRETRREKKRGGGGGGDVGDGGGDCAGGDGVMARICWWRWWC